MTYNDREWQLFCIVLKENCQPTSKVADPIKAAMNAVELTREYGLTAIINDDTSNKRRRLTNDTYNDKEWRMFDDFVREEVLRGECTHIALKNARKLIDVSRGLGLTEMPQVANTDVVETESELQKLQRMGQKCDAESVVDNKNENIIDKPSCQSQDIGKTITKVEKKRVCFIADDGFKASIKITSESNVRIVDEDFSTAYISRENVKDLLPYLQNFEKYGNFTGEA
jgi:hypothetical protein